MTVRLQRKSVLHLSIRESCSWHVLAQKSLQLSPKAFCWRGLITQFLSNLNSSKNFTSPILGKLRTEFTSPIANSTSLGYRTLLSSHTESYTRGPVKQLFYRCRWKVARTKASTVKLFFQMDITWTVLLRPIMKFVICRLLPFWLQV